MNIYQLHVSDDQGYSLPSAAYPRLPAVFALTAGEVVQLQTEAATLHIHIVAEIDLPGHSAALSNAIPALRAVNTRTGDPCNQINISSPAAIAILQTLVEEVMQMFPGLVHT